MYLYDYPKVSKRNNANFSDWRLFPFATGVCHRCQRHRWCSLSCEYLREFSKKIEMAVMAYSGAWGKLIHEKNQKSKISRHYPFNLSCGTVHCTAKVLRILAPNIQLIEFCWTDYKQLSLSLAMANEIRKHLLKNSIVPSLLWSTEENETKVSPRSKYLIF